MARTPPPRTPPRSRPLGLALALLVALVLRLALAAGTVGLTMDSPLYVRMAEAWRTLHPLASPAHDGYPLLIALVSFVVPGREWPGRVVSLLASLVLVALVHTLARRRGSEGSATAAALVVALHPLLAIYGSALMTEAPYLAIATAALVLLERGRARAGGALLGAAWWVRPEAAVVAPVAVLLAPLTPRARIHALALALLVALPYSAVVSAEQGHFMLSPKTSLVRAPFAHARDAEWRLEDAGALPDTVGLLTRLRRDGPAMLTHYPGALQWPLRRMAEAWSVPMLLLSLAGMATRAGRGAWLALLAPTFVAPLLAAPPELRYAQLALPALVLAAHGAAVWAWPRGSAWRAVLAAGALAGAVLVARGPATRLALAFDDGPMRELRAAGEWLAAHSRGDAVIMDRKSFVPFFAQRRHVQLPDEPLERLLPYALASGATHLVVEEYVVAALRPQLAPLLDAGALANEPRVRLVWAARPRPGDGVAVFELAGAPAPLNAP